MSHQFKWAVKKIKLKFKENTFVTLEDIVVYICQFCPFSKIESFILRYLFSELLVHISQFRLFSSELQVYIYFFLELRDYNVPPTFSLIQIYISQFCILQFNLFLP